MRVKYTVGGRDYELRTFQQRDHVAIRANLALLPTAGAATEMTAKDASIANDYAAKMLARCSIKPKLVLDYPENDPGDEVVAIDDLSDAEFLELFGKLTKDSGYSSEAAEEVRPSSATVET